MTTPSLPEALWSAKCAGHLLARGPVMVRTSDGEEYEIAEGEDGHLKVWARGGGNLFSTNSAGNVLEVVNWPNFQPITPPTDKRPVIASREHILKVMAPKSNGMSGKCRDAVQKALNRNPDIKRLIEETIHATLTKVQRNDGGYEEVVIRKEQK